jgi:hypothetical protein
MIQALDYGDRFPIFLLVAGAEIEDFLGIPRHFYLTRDTVRRLLARSRDYEKDRSPRSRLSQL